MIMICWQFIHYSWDSSISNQIWRMIMWDLKSIPVTDNKFKLTSVWDTRYVMLYLLEEWWLYGNFENTSRTWFAIPFIRTWKGGMSCTNVRQIFKTPSKPLFWNYLQFTVQVFWFKSTYFIANSIIWTSGFFPFKLLLWLKCEQFMYL